MDADQIRAALGEIQEAVLLIFPGLAPERANPTTRMSVGAIPASRHLLWMYDQAIQFLAEGRTEKAKAWLCFMQGSAWRDGLISIDNAREANK